MRLGYKVSQHQEDTVYLFARYLLFFRHVDDKGVMGSLSLLSPTQFEHDTYVCMYAATKNTQLQRQMKHALGLG